MVLAKLKRTKLKNLEKEEARVCGAEGGRLVMELKITLTIVKLLMTKMLWTLPGQFFTTLTIKLHHCLFKLTTPGIKTYVDVSSLRPEKNW